MKFKRDEMYEWTDPGTGEVHRCPKSYVEKLLHSLKRGIENAQLGVELLKIMGFAPTNSRERNTNERHLRQAAAYLRHRGILVVTHRSKEGGYFVAQNETEQQTHAGYFEQQGNALKAEAQRIKSCSVVNSLKTFEELKERLFL